MKSHVIILVVLILNISPLWLKIHQVFQTGDTITLSQTVAGFLIIVATVVLGIIYEQHDK